MTKKSAVANAIFCGLTTLSAHALPVQINDGAPFNLANEQIDYDPASTTLTMRTPTAEPALICADLNQSATTGPSVDIVNPSDLTGINNYTRFYGFDQIEYQPTGTTVVIQHTGLECYVIDSSSTTLIGPYVPPPAAPVITVGGSDPGPSLAVDVASGGIYLETLGVTTTETPVTWSLSAAPTQGSATIDSASGQLQYVAPSAFPASDSLEVTVTDNIGGTDTLTFNFTITDPSGDTIFSNAFEGGIAKHAQSSQPGTKAANGTGLATDAAVSVSTCTTNNAWDRPGDGQPFCYQITVSNNGTQGLSNVHVREQFPLDAATPVNTFTVYGDIGETVMPVCTGTACPGTLDVWATVIPSLPVGESVTLERVRTIHIPTPNTDPLIFHAAVFVAGDEDTSNNALRVAVQQNAAPTITDPEADGDAATTVSMDEDGSPTAFNMANLQATDPEGDTLVWSIATDASNGSASIDANTGAVSYSPNLNYNNDANTPDSFVVQVDDGYGGTDTFTVNVVVNPVNDAPEAVDSLVSTNESTSYTFAATDFGFTDVDGDSLVQVDITSLPSAGQLLYNNASFTPPTSIPAANIGSLKFTPAFGASGSNYASFQFQVSDGQLTSSAAATMTIDVIGVNDPPTGANGSISTNEDTAYAAFTTATFGYSDPEGDPMSTLFIYTAPQYGQLAVNGNAIGQGALVAASDLANLSYTPNSNYNGSDSFDFLVNDGSVYSSSTYTLNITVTPQPDAPVIVQSDGITPYGSSQSWTVSSTAVDTWNLYVSDPDVGDTANWSVSNNPSGNASIDSNGLISFDATGMNPGDTTSFAITVTDGDSLTDTLTFNVTVNTPPQITDSNGVVQNSPYAWTVSTANAANTLDLNATDPDAGDTATWSISTSPTLGSASIDANTGVITFDATSMTGGDTTSMVVTVTDSANDSASLTINITAQ